VITLQREKQNQGKKMLQNKAAMDEAAIDVSKPKLERFRGNGRDTLDIKTWCLQVSRLDQVQKLGDENTATIVMEALREQALHRALLLQDKKPDAAANWKLLHPLLIERFDKEVNETQKFKLIAALQQRQNKSSKDFLDRCKTAWYRLLRKLRTKYATDLEKAAHNDTHNECIKCMFICGMRNNIRMAVESIAGNTDSLETALATAVQYESAMNIGGQKQGGAQRYGQVAALEITGSSDAAASASSSNGPAGMQEMKMELAAVTSALAAIGVQKKGGKPKPPGGAPPRGPRKQPTGIAAGGAGTGRSTSDALGPIYDRDWIKCYMCRQWGQHIAAECTGMQAECDKLTPGAKLPPSGAAKDLLFNPN
jgi:hypothetical protein